MGIIIKKMVLHFPFYLVGIGTLMFMPAVYADSLTPLADTELSTISGGDAIQLTVRLRNNVDASNVPIGCEMELGNPNPCRLGLQFSAREPWLMLKEFYGSIAIEDARLEGAMVGYYPFGDAYTYNNGGSTVEGTGFADPERFHDDASNCLLTTCDFKDLPAVSLSYPESKGLGVYNDLNTFLNIGRVTMELNDGSTPGYMRDEMSGSALGFRISDSSGLNVNAQMRFEGRALLYGF